MRDERVWCQVRVVSAGGTVLARRTLAGAGSPDLRVLEELARLALVTQRSHGFMWVEHLAPELAELIDLAGLGVQVQGQPETREEPLGVQEGQEEAQPDDLVP